ncbi:MAG: DUF1304 domain-containing protein [Deltaproteobacteria bacterium]|nr:DUF1304 domain-containing protein [Deltaproteobacteria bacterium]
MTRSALVSLLANVAVVFVAVSHIGFLILEMFLWDHPVGRKIFQMTPEQSKFSATLAANQGLYNGFLAAGLLWGLGSNNLEFKLFFLICVVVAGLYGGFTANRTIWVIQALPALVALILNYAAFA